MTTRFNPGVGTAYIGAIATVLDAGARVDPVVSGAVLDDAEFDALVEIADRLSHAAVLSFDREDAALRIAMRGPVVVEVEGRRLASAGVGQWRLHRLLIESHTATGVVAALDRHACAVVGPHRVERGVVPAASVHRRFDPLPAAIDRIDAFWCPTTVDRPGRGDGAVAVADTAQALGVLVFSTGERVLLDRSVVLGRNPHPPRCIAPASPIEPRLVRLRAAGVSRQHAIVRVDEGRLVIDDLGSANGTRVTAPGSIASSVVPGVSSTLFPGSLVELGVGVSFVVDAVA